MDGDRAPLRASSGGHGIADAAPNGSDSKTYRRDESQPTTASLAAGTPTTTAIAAAPALATTKTAADDDDGGLQVPSWHTWTSSRREMIIAHLVMLAVGLTFSGYNVLLTKTTAFPADMDEKEQFCRQTVFITYRQSGATPILLLGAFLLEGRLVLPRTRRDLLFFLAQGFTGIYLNQFFFLLGLHDTSANMAALFQPLSPVVVIAISVAFRMERLTWRKALGILFGVAGAFIMAGLGVFTGPHKGSLGVAFLILNVVGSAAYLPLQKPLYGLYSAMTMTAYQYVVGVVCMGLTSIYCYDVPDAFKDPGCDHLYTWITVAYAICISSAANYFGMTWANKHIDSSIVGMYALVQPIGTAIISYIALHQGVKYREYGGGVAVAVGLVLVIWDTRIELERTKRARARLQAADDERQPLLHNPGQIQNGPSREEPELSA